MAENINIKVLIDAAESAKTIQETKKALRDLRTAALQVEEGSQAFQDITAAAGQLQDRIGDLAATTKYLGDDLKNLKGFTSIAQGIAGGFAIAQGAAQLFGVENGKVEESIMKLQTAMSLLQGVQAVGEVLQKESAATLFIQNGLRRTAIALAGEQAVAEAAEAVAAGTATVAQRALNAAMNANPILALVSLLVLATTTLYAFSKDTDKATEAEEKARKASEARTKALKEEEKAYSDFIGKEQSGYLLLTEQLKATNPQSKERLDLINKINETYGTTLKNLSDETLFQDQVNKSVQDYIEFLKLKYALQSNEKLIQENISKQAKLEKELATEQAALNESIEARKRAGYKDTGRDLRIALELQYKVVDDLQKQIDAADKRLQGYIKGAMNAQSKITTTGLKLSSDRVSTEKKTNEKILKEHKDFVADYTKLDEIIVDNTDDIQVQIVDGWVNTYEKQLLELKSSMESQKKTIIDEYNSALESVDTNFKSWAESSNITLKGLDTSQIQAYYDKFVSTQIGLNQKLQILETQKTVKLDQINRQYLVDQEKLFKEQSEKIKELIKESTNIVLATTEYDRYIKYVELKTKQMAEEAQKANQSEYDRLEKEYKKKFQLFKEYNDGILKLGESVNEKAEVSAKGFYKLTYEQQQKLTEQGRADYDMYQTKILQFISELDSQNAALKMVGSSIEDIGKKTDMVLDKAIIKAAELQNTQDVLSIFFGGEKATETDKTLMNYLDTLERTGRVTGFNQLATLKFGEALDQVKNSVDVVNAAKEKDIQLTDQMSRKTSQVISDVLALGREITTGEAGQNLLLSAVYVDKLNILKNAEKDISTEIETSNARNIEQTHKFVEAQKSLITAYQETLKDKSLTPIDAERYKTELAKAEEELKKFQEMETKFIEKQKTQKGFAIKPTGDQIGLEQLIKDYPELNSKILKLLEDRYNEMTKIENDFYEQGKFDLFTSLQKKEITQDEYDKKIEAMEVAHQENLLSIDVSYGKKGQDALAENEKKKGAIIKSEQEKVKASKEEFVQELIALEQTLQSGIMDQINAEYQLRIDNINREYDIRVGNIEAEARAYELSLQDRTAAEIQIAQKKQAFEDEITQTNIERENKLNQLRREQFNKQKAADIIQAGINGALAITRALAETGPFALAIQGLVAASVAAQIGFIAAQQPAFAEGGLVTGPGGPKDDKITARLSNGESVINAKSTKMYAPILSAINQAGGGKAIPFAKGGLVTNTPPPMTIGEKAMVVDTSRLERAIERLNERPIETYVKESRITAAQSQSQKEKRRTSF